MITSISDTRPCVLLVDNEPENIDVLRHILAPHYRIKAATSGERAIKIAQSADPPDLLLLDVLMPGISGYEVCQILKSATATRHIPIIFVTSMTDAADESRGFEIGAADYLAKPISAPIVIARVRTQLSLHNQHLELERQVSLRTAELEESRLELIHRLARAAEFKDNETGNHVIRMSHYARLIGQAIGMDSAEVALLFAAAPMHDIGKIGIPDYILLKPGALSGEERDLMQQHTTIGADILGHDANPLMVLSRQVALTHHEKWDGTGYPQGLQGTDIPLFGRIVAVADVFDALTSVRPYKAAWTTQAAVGALQKGAGGHFDPDIVQAFMSILPEALRVKESYSEDFKTNASYIVNLMANHPPPQ